MEFAARGARFRRGERRAGWGCGGSTSQPLRERGAGAARGGREGYGTVAPRAVAGRGVATSARSAVRRRRSFGRVLRGGRGGGRGRAVSQHGDGDRRAVAARGRAGLVLRFAGGEHTGPGHQVRRGRGAGLRRRVAVVAAPVCSVVPLPALLPAVLLFPADHNVHVVSGLSPPPTYAKLHPAH